MTPVLPGAATSFGVRAQGPELGWLNKCPDSREVMHPAYRRQEAHFSTESSGVGASLTEFRDLKPFSVDKRDDQHSHPTAG